jgi:hypothetical protein
MGHFTLCLVCLFLEGEGNTRMNNTQIRVWWQICPVDIRADRQSDS